MNYTDDWDPHVQVSRRWIIYQNSVGLKYACIPLSCRLIVHRISPSDSWQNFQATVEESLCSQCQRYSRIFQCHRKHGCIKYGELLASRITTVHKNIAYYNYTVYNQIPWVVAMVDCLRHHTLKFAFNMEFISNEITHQWKDGIRMFRTVKFLHDETYPVNINSCKLRC